MIRQIALVLLVGLTAASPQDPPRSNILVILADDLGYGDLGCYGHPKIRTPNIDRLAKDGLRLTDCYAAAANCSPARAGLMTGRTPYRAGIHTWIPHGSPMHLRREEVTVATLLRRAGYSTAHVGKWHLNGGFHMDKQPHPSDHGFDHWFSAQNNALPCHRNPDNFVRNGKPAGRLAGYSGPIVAHEATRWLREGRDRSKPFFLFVCFHEPHEPIATERRFTDLYPSEGAASPFDPEASRLAAHHGNVTQLDHSVGRVLAALDDLGLRKSTFVLFTSDNGPAITGWHPHGSPGPLREKKGHVYEGGIRVPGIVRWPGRVKPGGTSDQPVSGVDVLPTLCAMAGVRPPESRVLDGTSLLPLFEGGRLVRKRPLYWQFNSARSGPKVAMRDGEWKILARLTGREIRPGGNILAADQEAIKKAELASFELYNLRRDIGETTDLSGREPERLAAMTARLRKFYREVRDESPVWPTWEWDRFEGLRIRAYRKALNGHVKTPIRVLNPTALPAGEIPAYRVPLGIPEDYKPWIARLKSGDLLVAAFHAGRNPVREYAVFWRSTDGGLSWGPREPRPDVPGREFSLSVLSDGTILMPCHFLRQDSQNKAGKTVSMLYRSGDNGKTWSVTEAGPVNIDRDALEIRGTTVLGVSRGRTPDAFFWRSTDSGRTWDRTFRPETGGWDDVDGFFGQSTTFKAPSGKLLHVVRVDRRGKYWEIPGRKLKREAGDQGDRMMLWESGDRGATWKRHREHGTFGTYGEMYPRFLRLGGDKILLTFTVRSNATDGQPLGVRAIVSRDDGGTWDFTRDRLVIDAQNRPPATNSGGGYGNTVRLDDGTLVSVYSYRGEDGKTHVRTVRWRLPVR